MFAGLLDKERDIKDLVVELIMKYTSEKNEIFLRTCLLECPFVFNNCACFGQGKTTARNSTILTGVAKKSEREEIYQYLLRKIDPVYLYMYFDNMIRLLEFIENVPSLTKSNDLQASILDFIYICSQICVVNEKQKKNLEKIVKDSHDGQGLAIVEDSSQKRDADKEMDDGGNEKKGRANKKNAPTLTSSLAVVERVVPTVATIYELLQKTNPAYFQEALDTLCDNMCLHFESLLEYAQPREFWQAHLKRAKQAKSAATRKSRKKSAQADSGSDICSQISSRPPSTQPITPRSKAGTPTRKALTPTPMVTPSTRSIISATTPSRSRRAKETDSGLCTIDDADENYLSDESAFSELTISDVRSKKHANSRQSQLLNEGKRRKTTRR